MDPVFISKFRRCVKKHFENLDFYANASIPEKLIRYYPRQQQCWGRVCQPDSNEYSCPIVMDKEGKCLETPAKFLPKLNEDQVKQVLKNATPEQKARINEAYEQVSQELKKTYKNVGAASLVGPTLGLFTLGCLKLLKRQQSPAVFALIRLWKVGTGTMIGSGIVAHGYLNSESYFAGKIGDKMRPVINKVYDEQQAPAKLPNMALRKITTMAGFLTGVGVAVGLLYGFRNGV